MSDQRFRELERKVVTGGSIEDIKKFCAMLFHQGDKQRIRDLLHPLVRGHRGLREFFLDALPFDTNAFCHGCGDRFELTADGYPKGNKGKKAKRRKACKKCTDLTLDWRAGPRRRGRKAVNERYCGKCGAVLHRPSGPSHQCGKKRPDWISGGEDPNPQPSSKPHWSEWKRHS